MDAILSVLAEHLGDVPGLPSPQEILEAGDVEEQKEKELRRQREEALKQQFAASRVRVVDHLGRSYATGVPPPRLLQRAWRLHTSVEAAYGQYPYKAQCSTPTDHMESPSTHI